MLKSANHQFSTIHHKRDCAFTICYLTPRWGFAHLPCPRRSWAVTGVAHCVPSQRGVSLGLVPAWQDGWSPAAGAAVVLAVYLWFMKYPH